MKPIITLVVLIFSLFSGVYGQDFKFGEVNLDELDLNAYNKDTTANAVVLKEFGTARISSGDGTPLVFEYHVRMKIFNSKGFNQGNVVIPIYKTDNNRYETVSEISGVTISYDQNGNIKIANLDPKKVFRENKNRYWDQVKFAMPDLRDGCIIEYKYQLTSPYIFNFRKWVFQWDIPKVYSEYIARIPAVYNYNVSLKGSRSLVKNTAIVEKECFTPGGGFKADCSQMTYAMADVPALVEEDYMTAASNFRAAIDFELSDYVDYHNIRHKVTLDWKDVDYDLKKHESFGSQIKKKDFFKERIIPVIGAGTDELSKAKAVYAYIQKWFKWNNSYHIYSDDGIRKAFENHTGSVADINLSLIAALSAANLNTEAVLLSTRDNGIINKLYPILSDFNYVVAKVNIGADSYLLDATDPLLPFGLLPIRCINDQGRVISINKPSFWMDLKASQKESKVYSLNLKLQDNGKINGSLSGISFGYEAYNKRKAIKKFNSFEEYTEDMDDNMPGIKILKSNIQNIDSLDNALIETYDIEIDAFDNLNKERFSFNPFFIDPLKENPFKLTQRSYPVDWGAPSDIKINVILAYPDVYEVLTKPQNVGLTLPGNGGKFLSNIVEDGQQIIFSQMTQLNKSIYSPDEYPYLKELFNKIIQVQKSEIIFKKKI